MTRVFLNDDLTIKLPSLGEFLEVCDSSGRVVGHISPVEPDSGTYENLKLENSGEETPRPIQEDDGQSEGRSD